MRPTDEDQSGSRRPNLMSSTRRTASETNILAMLDRHESGGPGRRLLRGLRGVPAMAWYGAAGVLVVALVGSLAWLARDSGPPSSADSGLAGVTPSRPAPMAGAAATPPVPASAATTAAATAASEVVADANAGRDRPPAAAGATIVDLAPAQPAQSTEPADPAPAPRALPPQEHAGRILPRDVQHDPRHERERLASAPKPAPRTAAGRPPSAARSQAAAHAEARSRRAAARQQAPAADDTDVALITAIIQHASKRQEAEEEGRKP